MCYEPRRLARTLSIVAALVLVSCGSRHASAQQTVFDKPASETSQNASQASQLPRLQIDETSFDFGTVDEGEIVRHAFKVRNLGSGELQIARVNPG